MPVEKETWGEYSKLVLNELERLNENYEEMRKSIDTRFQEMNESLSDFKSTEKIVYEQKVWIEKVNDVWSPVQMKEAKDELYSLKNKWIAAAAILAFIQIALGIAFAIWSNLGKK